LIDDAGLVGPNLEAVSAVRGLQVVGVLSAKLKHALHRSGDVLVEPIRELDDDHRAFSGRAQQTPDYRSTRFAAYFAKDDFHASKLAQTPVSAKRARKNPAFSYIRESCAAAQSLPPLPRRTGCRARQNAAPNCVDVGFP
jgi:hypothetical protein